jgi:hypothetical protein
LGFTKSEAYPNLYLLQDGKIHLILVLNIDDLFLIGDEEHIAKCKKDLASKFDMKDIGLMHYFMGLKVWK